MRLPNTSPEEILTILERNRYLGCFYVPKILFELPLTKTEKMFLVVLFKLKHDFQQKSALHDRWFFATTKTLASMIGCKDTMISYVRQRLGYMELIQYRRSEWAKGRATYYKILLPDF